MLGAYDDYALNAQLIRLEQSNLQLLRSTDGRDRSPKPCRAAGELDVLKAKNDVDISRNEIANMQSQLPGQLAAINALLSRPAGCAVAAAGGFAAAAIHRLLRMSNSSIWPRNRIPS